MAMTFGARRRDATEWIGLAARGVLSGLFLVSGWSKLQDPAAFYQAIQGYDLVADPVARGMTWVLPWLEVWTVVALWATPLFRRSAWIWITLMLIVFTGAKAAAAFRGLDISCGCTGSDTPLTWFSVMENGIWLILAGIGLGWDWRFPKG